MAMKGLCLEVVAEKQREFGLNQLPDAPQPGIVHLFLKQFLSPFIYILLAAAVVSFLLGQTPSGVFILVVLFINAIIGTIQEFSAQRAAAALKSMVKGQCHVIRNNQVLTIDTEQLVPGDIVSLSSGDKVPADMTLLDANNLAVDESMLTGESLAVVKNAQAKISETAPLSARVNACFAGSIVTQGRATGEVSSTGINTQLGKIAKDVNKERTSEPPLMIRIRAFTYQITFGILIAIVLLTVLMLVKGGYSFNEMALMSIGLAVSVIPEGLPAALTVALAIGMSRMAKNNVIIRKLFAVEALGSCTFICSDKTGTLTVNELTIREVVLPGGECFHVTGEGVAPGGDVVHKTEDTETFSPDEAIAPLCEAGVLANESFLDYAGGEWASQGDIVDIAFLVLAKKSGISVSGLREQQRNMSVVPYESENAYSGLINRTESATHIYAKGSPEKMLSMCSTMMTREGTVNIDTDRITQQFTSLAEEGYRLIALANKTIAKETQPSFTDMTFLGLVAMIDPLRAEAKAAIKQCRDGGIDVAMITGDHPATAKAIAIELGLCDANASPVTGELIRETSGKDTTKFDQLVRDSRVFARIEPQQKERIVDSFMRAGHFVAVTGDGVNDAPAMRKAHAGIAMGKRGTDVAKETADLIITDDNFASIVAGIEQGRVVYNNIRKVIGLLVATGFSAILLFFLCVLAGLPMPLIAVQLLWLNLVANGLQDVALAFEPKEGEELNVPPRSPNQPIFERHIIEHVLIVGTVMGAIAFAFFSWTLAQGSSINEARNLTLMLMVLFGNIHALNSRSESRSLFSLPLHSNLFLLLAVPTAQLIHICAMYVPVLSDVLVLTPISFTQWAQLLVLASTLIIVEEAHKAWIRFRYRLHIEQDVRQSTQK